MVRAQSNGAGDSGFDSSEKISFFFRRLTNKLMGWLVTIGRLTSTGGQVCNDISVVKTGVLYAASGLEGKFHRC